MSTNGKHPPDPADHDIPEDLRILCDRLAEAGVHVRLLVSSAVQVALPMIQTYRPRPGDAAHLGAAILARAAIPSGADFVFVTSDENQKKAARAEEFDVWDPAA